VYKTVLSVYTIVD